MPFLPPRSASLASFFTPNGVAVIGASRDPSKLSFGLLRNLADPERGYPGPIYPVNPKVQGEILGLRSYPDIGAVPDPVELAVLIIPAAAVPAVMEACGRRGVKAAVVISGGFQETGPDGAAREQEVVEIARRYGMRMMGPNGIGVIDTYTPLNTTFVKGMPPRGHIAFVSQSGALCGGVIDWTMGRGIGFSRLLSVGNEADVNETDVIPFLAADYFSRVIALYLEDVKGGPAFVDALREAVARKPVLVLKAGRTASGQAATASHTGALAGAHTAFRAACVQAGAIETEGIEALFDGAMALAYQPAPAGSRVAILTNSGGPAALAADAFEAAGLSLARVGPETQELLRRSVHRDVQVMGPVDLLGGADEHSYRKAADAVLADPAVDGVLAILVPQVLVNPVAVVQALAAAAAQVEPRKPLLLCLMGEASLQGARQAAHAAEIPAYTFPENSVAAFEVLWKRAQWLRRGHRQAEEQRNGGAEEQGSRPLQGALPKGRRHFAHGAEGQRVLETGEAHALLKAYGVPTPPQALAKSACEVVDLARHIGFPVALKLVSPDILHKTDVGGVILGLQDEEAVRAGYETLIARAVATHPKADVRVESFRGVLVQKMITGGQEVIIGVKHDPTFGPLVMFGLGGVYVEALADVSFRLAPLTAADAWDMLEEVRSAKLLKGLRGAPPADMDALVDLIVQVGHLAADHPEIAELDLNPILVLPRGQGVIAVDVRVILTSQ